MTATYIRMSSNLLNDGIIKVSRITQEITSDIVCVFHALEDISRDRKLRPFSELGSLILALEVDVLDPTLMLGGGSLEIPS